MRDRVPLDLAPLDLDTLWAELTRDGITRRLIALAAEEDLGTRGDITSHVCVGEGESLTAAIVAREDATLAGLRGVPMVIQALGPDVAFEAKAADGQRVPRGETVGLLGGPKRQILAVERTLLNLVGRLSGVATLATRYVQAAANRDVSVCDTRKTTPGWRALEKYAVRCGGGTTHRLALHDAVLIKDNHLAGVEGDELAELVKQAAAKARAIALEDGHGLRFVECEVDRPEQFKRLLDAGACGTGKVDVVLLDNMSTDQLSQCVEMRAQAGLTKDELQLEASGGVNLDTIAAIARTGVDRISVGALTHQATSVDFGLDAI